MKLGRKWFIIGMAAALCLWAVPTTVAQKESAKEKPQAKPPRDYPVKPVPFTAVHFTRVVGTSRLFRRRVASRAVRWIGFGEDLPEGQ